MAKKQNYKLGLPRSVDPGKPEEMRRTMERVLESLQRMNGEHEPCDRVVTICELRDILLTVECSSCSGGGGGDDDEEDVQIVANGGVIAQDGDYKVHTFTNNVGAFTVTEGNGPVELLVVGGGGAGGWCSISSAGGGGGGGAVVHTPAYDVSVGMYPVVVGRGGDSNAATQPPAGDGGYSSFADVTALGGGHGGSTHTTYFPNGENGADGGCGGGGSASKSGGQGTSEQGYAGGDGSSGGTTARLASGGGGGGAGELGGSSPNVWNGGDGGDGVASTITGSSITYGGGGGGGRGFPTESSIPPAAVGMGGAGGGGSGGNDVNLHANQNPVAGTNGLGGGGGGGGSNGFTGSTGAAGGSGVVIVRYYSPEPFEATTWDASDKTADIVLSGDDLVASSTANTYETVRSVRKNFSLSNGGKYFWKMTGAGGDVFVGLRDAGTVITSGVAVNSAGSCAVWRVYGSPPLQTGGWTLSGGVPPQPAAPADELWFALDANLGHLWVGKKDSSTLVVTWGGGGDPAAGTNPTWTGMPAGNHAICCSTDNGVQDRTVTLITDPASLAADCPSGFTAGV